MTQEAKELTIRRYFRAIEDNQLDQLDSLLASGFVLEFGGVPAPLDAVGTKHLFGSFLAAFPDVRHHLEAFVVEDEKVAFRMRVSGTHLGPFNGMPATGKRFEIQSLNIMHFQDGKVAAQWAQADMMGMMQQLGQLPMAQPA